MVTKPKPEVKTRYVYSNALGAFEAICNKSSSEMTFKVSGKAFNERAYKYEIEISGLDSDKPYHVELSGLSGAGKTQLMVVTWMDHMKYGSVYVRDPVKMLFDTAVDALGLHLTDETYDPTLLDQKSQVELLANMFLVSDLMNIRNQMRGARLHSLLR